MCKKEEGKSSQGPNVCTEGQLLLHLHSYLCIYVLPLGYETVEKFHFPLLEGGIFLLKSYSVGTSLMVQWLRLCYPVRGGGRFDLWSGSWAAKIHNLFFFFLRSNSMANQKIYRCWGWSILSGWGLKEQVSHSNVKILLNLDPQKTNLLFMQDKMSHHPFSL